MFSVGLILLGFLYVVLKFAWLFKNCFLHIGAMGEKKHINIWLFVSARALRRNNRKQGCETDSLEERGSWRFWGWDVPAFVDGKVAHRRASDICSSLCPEQKISVPSADGQVWSSCSTGVCLLSVLQLIRRSLPTLGKDHPISPSSYARVTLTSKHPLRMPRIMFKRISGHLRPSEVDTFNSLSRLGYLWD